MSKKVKKTQIPTLQEQIYSSMSEEDKKYFRTFSELQAVCSAVFNDMSEEGRKKALDIMNASCRQAAHAEINKQVKTE